jgi:hypothetical protein
VSGELVQHKGFSTISDWGFLISEVKKIPLFFLKYRSLHFRNPISDIRVVRRISNNCGFGISDFGNKENTSIF